MVIAGAGYALLIAISLTLKVDGVFGAELWLNRLFFFLFFFMVVNFATNWFNIWGRLHLKTPLKILIMLLIVVGVAAAVMTLLNLALLFVR